MRPILLAALLCTPAWSAITTTVCVSLQKVHTATNAASCTGVTAGDYLVIFAANEGVEGSSGHPVSMTGADNQDHTGGFGSPLQTVDWIYASYFQGRSDLWVVKAGNTGTYIVTITPAETVWSYLIVARVTGSSGVNTSGTATAGPGHPSVALTTTVANCAIFGLWLGQNPNYPNYTDSGFTGMGVDVNDDWVAGEYELGASLGTNVINFNNTSAGSIIAVALQPAATGTVRRRVTVTQ